MALGIFSIALTVLSVLFKTSVGVLQGTNSRDSAEQNLMKASTAVFRDLSLASPSLLARTRVAPSLGGGDDGEALWFLSPIDPVSGEMVFHSDDSSPVWQRNVLYYITVPLGHDAQFAQTCAGTAGPGNFDQACPHKVLIRKVIDSGAPTVATDESTEESLLSDVSTYLTRPNGYNVSGIQESGVEEVRIISTEMLSFRTFPGITPQEIRVTLNAVPILEARREVALGTTPLHDHPLNKVREFSVFLRNQTP